ncbi:MAG: bifunctional histidinol-phosphatase/imidazoleglycerol-phosphate dehydratase HisB [Bacteroidia bacterium]|nr:bifunctional histidinol-phosphatase/imidazoleglycerol-phosphate dehydratase HisB [Bacteroidia bacterium]
MKKVLFIDRDGTLIKEPEDFQIDSFEKWEFLPGVFRWFGKIAREMDYELVMVTNQDGLGTPSFPEHTFWPIQNKLLLFLENEGIVFNEICIDRSFEHENLPTRKPATGMLTKYLYGSYDLKNSFVIGDRKTDVMLAKNLGARSIRITDVADPDADFSVKGWKEIYEILKGNHRRAQTERKTNETNIYCEINLNGSGKADIRTGIGFLDHMIQQWVVHGGMDILIRAEGDLHVDTHHTTEDVAIVLGMSIDKALGSRKGIGRYGFVLPMDESEAKVSMDFGGRPELVWNVTFTCEKLGELPAEMIEHFFKSFVNHARCNLHVHAYGTNNHHKSEAIFKATARAMKMAFGSNYGVSGLPSSKGQI